MPSAGCLAAETDALHRELPRIPRSLRAPTLSLQTQLLAWLTGMARHAPPDTLCVVTTQGNSTGSSCGQTPAEVRNGLGVSNDNGIFSSVVPDGVAFVWRSARGTILKTRSVPTAAQAAAICRTHRIECLVLSAGQVSSSGSTGSGSSSAATSASASGTVTARSSGG